MRVARAIDQTNSDAGVLQQTGYFIMLGGCTPDDEQSIKSAITHGLNEPSGFSPRALGAAARADPRAYFYQFQEVTVSAVCKPFISAGTAKPEQRRCQNNSNSLELHRADACLARSRERGGFKDGSRSLTRSRRVEACLA
jgi:hypothetical protein